MTIKKPKFILVKIKASHYDFINGNAVKYTDKAVKDGHKSWTIPFLKPNLINHDKMTKPLGRITSSSLQISDDKTEPPKYVELVVKVTDPDAIDMIIDGRYLTVSVGSRSDRIICSECGTVINEEGLCEHKKGSYNEDGKQIYWLIDQIEYTECSYVNDPADPYAKIYQINIGDGWLDYKEFLDSNYSYLEDNMPIADAKLSAATRNKLPDSAFCYVVGTGDNKVRKFPAHDAAHVQNGLARLNQADLPSAAKQKVLACLKRKAKRFNVKVSDELETLDPAFRLDDEFTAEEIEAMNKFFEANPKVDELEDEIPDEPENTPEVKDVNSMKKNELVDHYNKVVEEKDEAIKARDEKIVSLTDELQRKDTILIERENEVNKGIDDNVLLAKNYKDALVNNIVDLKMTKNDKKEDLVKKYSERSVASLLDTLVDLRNEKHSGNDEVNGVVVDPTLQDTNTNPENINNGQNDSQEDWDPFKAENATEVE